MMRLALLGSILNVLDLGTTILAVGFLGAVEMNPIIAPYVMNPWFWALKIATITGVFWAAAYYAQLHRSARATLFIMVGIMAIVVSSNILGIIQVLQRL